MIRFLFGDDALGKTEHILEQLRKDSDSDTVSILIVPEQQAVQTEILTLNALPPSAQLTLEVLNFSRLYNRVCREYGGLCYSYITKPMKHIMMWRAIREMAPNLKRYGENATGDPAFVKTMLSAIGELKSCSVRLEDLDAAIKGCTAEQTALSERIEDIAVIYGAYDALVSKKYSDSADDLSKLCDILFEHDFFKGKNVYIDSFTSFTAVEHRVIERIFATADNVTVSVPLPSATYRDISTASIENSLNTLKKHADRWGGHTDVIVSALKNSRSCTIEYLSKNLWNMNTVNKDHTPPPCGENICAYICDTSYAEAEAVASTILELLREGKRCRDMVIIMRDAEKYRGIIEPALEKAGIPFFFSEKTDICALSPIKLILTALRIYRFNWRKSDIIAHIKTGLCDFPMRDADIFEEYINTWSISGSRFTDGDWTMNPDGYVDKTSDRGKIILATANRIRRALCEPLEEFFVLLRAADTVPDMCRAVYSYIENIGLEDKLRELSARERNDDNIKNAEELNSAYGIILRALADIAEALSDMCISVDEFSDVLKTVFEQTEIGTIPTSVDEVTIGSASLLRASDPAYVFVMGLCEGEFPASVDDTGIFSSGDRAALSELGVDLGSDTDTRSSDELMFVKKAFSAPKERLYILTSVSGIKGESRTPSLPFRRVEALFPDLAPHRFHGNDLSFLCGSPVSAAAHLRNIRNAADRAAVTEAIAEHLPLVRTLSLADTGETSCRVDKQLVRQLVGDTISISPSSFEKYVKCPFSYYTGYLLSLRERQYGSFRANNFGSFVHFVLEHMIGFAVPDDDDAPVPSHDDILRETERIVDLYIQKIVPDEALRTKRMAHIYNKLKRLSVLLIENTIKEFADCDFKPAFFELHTDGRDDGPRPLVIPLSNGAKVVLKGIIDRVDIWKNDGRVYVRIVDYKTGSKEFDLEDVSHGLNTQMLLYLFSICAGAGKRFRNKTGLAEGESPIPAGIVYLSSALPRVEIKELGMSDDEVILKTEAELVRSGILLDDDNVIHAFSHSESKSFLLGVAKNKSGDFVGKALISSEDLTGLYSQIEDTIKDIATRIYEGIADSTPLHYGDQDPCKYCSVKPICRKNSYK